MDKHKNADRHKIYPSFREFYGKGLFKADRTLKEEYQCSKCGRKIRINDYEKMKYRDSCIQWFLYILYFYFFIIFARKAADAFLKIVYEIPDFLLRLLSVFFAVVVAGFLFFMLLMVVIWLGRVFFLKWYCAKLQKEEQKKEAAELDAKLRAEFGVGQQASVFDTVDVLGMLSTQTDKAYREEQNHANALGSNDDDSYWDTGSGNEDALGGRIGAVDDAGRPIDPYMNLDDRLTDEMLRERQDTAAQRSDERAKAVAEKTAAAKALSETQEKDDGRDANDLDWAMPSGEQPTGNAAGRPQQQQGSLDDMFGLDDDDDDDLMGFSAPQDPQQAENGQGGSQPYGIGGLDDLGDLDDDDF